MLLAYMDEFGHVGPYIAPDHPKFKTHPVFGYAGFVMPANNVREFGAFFEHIKENLLRYEIERDGKHPRRWEKKGASLLTTTNVAKYPDLTVAIHRLLRRLHKLDGRVIYYGQLKPTGSAKETGESAEDRNAHCLRQTLARLSQYAKAADSNVMVVLDSTDDKPRLKAVENMSKFIYARTSPPEVKRIVEAPMQVESQLYGTIQFADWMCALIGRLSHYEFVKGSEFDWAPSKFGQVLSPACAKDVSKIHLTPTDMKDVWTKHLCDAQTTYSNRPSQIARQTSPTQRRPSPRGIEQSLGERFPALSQLKNSLG